MKRACTVAAAAVMAIMCAGLGGCDRRHDEPPAVRSGSVSNSTSAIHVPGGAMPAWLDLYKNKNIVNVATVDHVVIVTFETHGQRDDVFGHYSGKFGNEDSFVSFRDNRDIISFLRDGYGVKITLLDSTRNLWSLEYHKQAI